MSVQSLDGGAKPTSAVVNQQNPPQPPTKKVSIDSRRSKSNIYRKKSLPIPIRPSQLFLSRSLLSCERSLSVDDGRGTLEGIFGGSGPSTLSYLNSPGLSDRSLDDSRRSLSSLDLSPTQSLKSINLSTLNRLDGISREDLPKVSMDSSISVDPMMDYLQVPGMKKSTSSAQRKISAAVGVSPEMQKRMASITNLRKISKVNTEEMEAFMRQRGQSDASESSSASLRAIKYLLALSDPEISQIFEESFEPQEVMVHLTKQGIISWSDDVTNMLKVSRETRILKLVTMLRSLNCKWWEPFIQAVRCSNQHNIADCLEEKLSEIESALQFKGGDMSSTQKLQIILKNRYLQDRKINISQWRNLLGSKVKEFRVEIDFTDLELIADATLKTDCPLNLKTKHLLTILKDAKRLGKKFILEGEPGIGKSTIASTIVTEWAGNSSQLGYWLNQEYEMIFLVRLNEVAPGHDLTESIAYQFGESSFQNDIDDFLNNEECREKTLLILDGFDEFSACDDCDDFLDIIRSYIFSEFSIIITTRPIQTSTLMDCAQFKTVVRCNGLSETSIREYFHNYLPEHTSVLDDLQAKELFRNPMFLDIYRAAGTSRDDYELFYILRHFTQTILQRHFKKTHKLHSEDVDLHRQLMNFLSAEAFRLYAGNQHKTVTVKKLLSMLTSGNRSSEQLADLAFRTGLLFHPRKKQREGLEITSSMFPHNLFLQYFAAMHSMKSLTLTIQSSDYTKRDPFYLYFCSGFSQKIRAKGAWWCFNDTILTCRWIASLPQVPIGVTDKAIRWMSEIRGTESFAHQMPWVRRMKDYVDRNGPLKNLTGKYVIKNCYFGPDLADLCSVGYVNTREFILWKCELPTFIPTHFPALHKLKMAFCTFSKSSYHLLIDFFEANKDTLVIFSLWGSKGWIEHRELHPRFLQVLQSSKIQDLDLSGCQLDLHFIKLLADALPDCPSFNSLQVSGNSAIWQEGTNMEIVANFLDAVKYSGIRGLSLNKWEHSKPISSEFIDNFVCINTFNESLTQVQVGGHRSFDDRKDFFDCLLTMTDLKEVLCSRSCKKLIPPLKEKGIRVMHAY